MIFDVQCLASLCLHRLWPMVMDYTTHTPDIHALEQSCPE